MQSARMREGDRVNSLWPSFFSGFDPGGM